MVARLKVVSLIFGLVIATAIVRDMQHPLAEARTHRFAQQASAHNRHGCNATAHWDCRSLEVKHAFWIASGYPHGRPGWVVDHIEPLDCGGPDAVFNMQWQARSDAKVKDAWETTGCKDGHRYAGHVIVRGQYQP